MKSTCKLLTDYLELRDYCCNNPAYFPTFVFNRPQPYEHKTTDFPPRVPISKPTYYSINPGECHL